MAKAKRGQGWVEPRPYTGGVRYQARMQVGGSILALGPIRDTRAQAERDRVLGSDKHEHGTLTRVKKGRLGPSLVQWLQMHQSTASARTFYDDVTRLVQWKLVPKDIGTALLAGTSPLPPFNYGDCDRLARREVREIRPAEAQDLLSRVERASTGKQALKLHATIRQAFTYFIRMDLTLLHPFLSGRKGGKVTLPKVERREHTLTIPTTEELTKLKDWAVTDDVIGPIVTVMCHLPMRPGEAAGLRLENLSAETLQVTHAAQWVRGQATVLKTPKTRAGRRTLPIPAAVAEALVRAAGRRERMEMTATTEERAGWTPGLLFPGEDGTLMTYDALVKRFERAKKATGVRKAVRMYDLRHRVISDWIESGVPIAAVSGAAGHSNVSITLSIYTHATDRGQEALRAFLRPDATGSHRQPGEVEAR
jgi:integrase